MGVGMWGKAPEEEDAWASVWRAENPGCAGERLTPWKHVKDSWGLGSESHEIKAKANGSQRKLFKQRRALASGNSGNHDGRRMSLEAGRADTPTLATGPVAEGEWGQQVGGRGDEFSGPTGKELMPLSNREVEGKIEGEGPQMGAARHGHV